MPDACSNCVRLQAELETARAELSNGVSVLNKREEHSRAEVAELKRELARMQELLAKP